MAKILIVDDSPFTHHLLGVIVKMGGHQVIGWANKSIEARVLQAGAKAFIEKCNVQKELLQVIDKVMEN